MSYQLQSEAARKVALAWAVPGPNPDFHKSKQQIIWREWPRLAEALDELVQSRITR